MAFVITIKGFQLAKFLLNGKEEAKANKGDIVKIFPINYKPGDFLHKSLNKELFDELEDYIKPYSKNNFKCHSKFAVNSPVALNINYKGKEYTYTGE